MNRFTKLTVGAMMLAGAAGPALAQDNMGGGSFIKPPVFVLQPGLTTDNVISKPNGAGDSESGFNLRFVTVIPTSSRYFNFVAGTGFHPNGTQRNTANNLPVFFYGAIIPITFVDKYSGGNLSLSFNPLGAFIPGGGNDSKHFYGHDFVAEGALSLSLGKMMMSNMGYWSGLGVYFLVDQKVTHPTKYLDNNGKEQTDRFNPTLLYGLTLPIAPWPGSK